MAEGAPVAVGWGSAVVGTCAWVVGASVGDEVLAEVVAVMLGTVVGKRVLDGLGVAEERGGSVVLVVVLGRTTGAVGLSTLGVGLAGTGSAAAGRTIR